MSESMKAAAASGEILTATQFLLWLACVVLPVLFHKWRPSWFTPVFLVPASAVLYVLLSCSLLSAWWRRVEGAITTAADWQAVADHDGGLPILGLFELVKGAAVFLIGQIAVASVKSSKTVRVPSTLPTSTVSCVARYGVDDEPDASQFRLPDDHNWDDLESVAGDSMLDSPDGDRPRS